MRKVLLVNDELHRMTKAAAAAKGVPLQDFVDQALRAAYQAVLGKRAPHRKPQKLAG